MGTKIKQETKSILVLLQKQEEFEVAHQKGLEGTAGHTGNRLAHVIGFFSLSFIVNGMGEMSRLLTNFLCLPDRLIFLSRIDQAERFA